MEVQVRTVRIEVISSKKPIVPCLWVKLCRVSPYITTYIYLMTSLFPFRSKSLTLRSLVKHSQRESKDTVAVRKSGWTRCFEISTDNRHRYEVKGINGERVKLFRVPSED